MPAVVSSTVGSLCGTSELLATSWCCLRFEERDECCPHFCPGHITVTMGRTVLGRSTHCAEVLPGASDRAGRPVQTTRARRCAVVSWQVSPGTKAVVETRAQLIVR